MRPYNYSVSVVSVRCIQKPCSSFCCISFQSPVRYRRRLDITMIDLLKAMPGPPGKDGKSQDHMLAAQNIWKALDDMAEADPEQYKKFIQQQMESAQQLGFKEPADHPAVILTTAIQPVSKHTSAAVISLFENEKCQPPKESGKLWSASAAQLSAMVIEFKVQLHKGGGGSTTKLASSYR